MLESDVAVGCVSVSTPVFGISSVVAAKDGQTVLACYTPGPAKVKPTYIFAGHVWYLNV